jgi:hypothetical protein
MTLKKFWYRRALLISRSKKNRKPSLEKVWSAPTIIVLLDIPEAIQCSPFSVTVSGFMFDDRLIDPKRIP